MDVEESGAGAVEEPARSGGRRARALRVLRALPAFLARLVLRVGMGIAGAAAVLQLLPYRATVQDVPLTVRGNLFAQPGLTAETTLGSWEFPYVTGLPVGVTVTPRDVDLLQLVGATGGDRAATVERLRADVTELAPRIATWLAAEAVLGMLLGVALAAAIGMAVRYLRGAARRPHEARSTLVQLGGALGVAVLVAGYGWATYDPDWARQSRLTGTLAAAQLFPDQLSRYYEQNNKVFDVLGSVLGIQAALQDEIDEDAPETALRIMYVSDMHLAANYPLVQFYASSYDVDLIVNTGDESLFGTTIELTDSYVAAVTAVAAQTPMLWLAGNHDSPSTEATMRTVPGVTVLGSKQATADGYRVRAGYVEAFGLTVAGLPDPRVYGGPGAYGADDPAVTDPLQRGAVEEALADVVESDPDLTFDVFAAHEPIQAEALRELLPGRIRQTNAGHTHRQNDPDEIQQDGQIDLVEGSTGAGGLTELGPGSERPPIAFSIESVAPNCQFTRVVRFQIDSSRTGVATSGTGTPQAFGDDVTATTRYFTPQDVETGRTCGPDLGISAERPL
ncbi:metallophosphoesterase family protein [Blastococcus sp. SYSU D00695]